MTENVPYAELRGLTQRRIRLIWEMAQLGAELEPDDALLVRIMGEHPEYADLWPRLDEIEDLEALCDGVNPIVHVTTHQIIENQLADAEVPRVRETFEALLERGHSRHDAIHAIGGVLMQEMWEMMHDERPFNEDRYHRGLRRLARPRRPARRRGRRRKR